MVCLTLVQVMGLITVLMRARSLVEDNDDEEDHFYQLLFVQRPPGMTKKRRPGVSRPGRSKNKQRDYHSRHLRLLEQYMIPFPVYNEHDFRRRFCMHCQIFSRIMTAVVQYDSFFEQNRDAAGRVGISPLLKGISALRVLAYASSFDPIDEILEMSETTVKNCVQHFCEAVIAVFSPEYLRPPTPSEVRDVLEENAKRGFVGMVGSIDRMH
ncbi:hypothetical protein PR003_g17675 [Phytophthora rubi]|uniref:Nuclease HARBI1 n=1 Tax=Phytophthora rubi TaxID=129364 RepID=A0A6A3LY89_9STRA|nr:hypothetical protein PR002_g13032 [Phytophthora rubi]KAE9024226.1 hypothetical protein PR001_g12728 [Phytophthora rubi]KAE9320608.1 hypothetical protein PR003_g17675 [Phytophthora rubi]